MTQVDLAAQLRAMARRWQSMPDSLPFRVELARLADRLDPPTTGRVVIEVTRIGARMVHIQRHRRPAFGL